MDLKKHRGLIYHPVFWVTIIAIAVVSLLVKRDKPITAPSKQEASWNVSVHTLIIGKYQPIVRLHGVVTSFNEATLRSAIEADVDKVLVKDGEQVSSSSLLVKLDKTIFELNVKEREAEINKLYAAMEKEKINNKVDIETIEQDKKLLKLSLKSRQRYSTLRKRDLSSQAQVDEADKAYSSLVIALKKTELRLKRHQSNLKALEADLEKAKIALKKAKIDLEDTEIAAPFDGRITDVMVSAGDRIMKNTPILSLYNTDSLEVKAQLTERLRKRLNQALKQHQKIYATLDDTIPIQLSRVDTSVEEGDSNVDAYFTVSKEHSHDLALGMTHTLNLKLPQVGESYLIPKSSLYHSDTIYVVALDKLESIKIIQLGITKHDDDYYYIIQPKERQNLSGKQVVRTKLPFIRSGMKVKIL